MFFFSIHQGLSQSALPTSQALIPSPRMFLLPASGPQWKPCLTRTVLKTTVFYFSNSCCLCHTAPLSELCLSQGENWTCKADGAFRWVVTLNTSPGNLVEDYSLIWGWAYTRVVTQECHLCNDLEPNVRKILVGKKMWIILPLSLPGLVSIYSSLGCLRDSYILLYETY